MSATTSALRPGAALTAGPGARDLERSRPFVRMVAFTGLVLLGSLRWATLLVPAASDRVLELAAVALALSVLGPLLAARSRPAAALVAVGAGLGMLAISGLPLAWIRDLRVAVSAHAIGQGLDALPRLLVPYKGINPWVRMVINMGAAVLLLDAALMMAFAMEPPGSGPRAGTGDLRRAVAALPLIALVAVPLTLVPVGLPYAQGLILFVLLAAFIWGERLPRAASGGAVLVCAVAAVAAMVIAPAIDAHTPWINYRTLAGAGGGGGSGELFNWNQSYNQLTWPQEGRDVLEVRAPHADYWKVESLDAFALNGWQTLAGGQFGGGPSGLIGVSAANVKRWTQTDTFTIGAMKTSLVVGEGSFGQPVDATEVIGPGPVPGTYISANPMGTGDAYRVRAYSPRATPAELAGAGTGYPGAIIPQELAVGLPSSDGYQQETVWVDPFGSPPPHLIESYEGSVGATLIAASPYAPVYALAQRLRAGARTPYAYAQRIMAYLGHGFQYTLSPVPSADPIVDFLLRTHAGYCQQFAGAMALLLRLGGVPARVAVGFTSGQLDAATRQYVVSDFDAHAWVEVYFPTYGWVRFDPTPPVDIALQHSVSGALLPNGSAQQAPEPNRLTKHGLTTPGQTASQSAAPRSHHRRSGGSGALVPGLAVVASLVLLLGLLMILAPAPAGDLQLRELERAFARSGRPLAPHVTLAELERRMAGLPGAEGYLRTLSAARFGVGSPDAVPGRVERRALRAHLRAGLGASGRLRALWAVPPPGLARLGRLRVPRRTG